MITNQRVNPKNDPNLLLASFTDTIFPRIAPIAENARRSVAEDSEVWKNSIENLIATCEASDEICQKQARAIIKIP